MIHCESRLKHLLVSSNLLAQLEITNANLWPGPPNQRRRLHTYYYLEKDQAGGHFATPGGGPPWSGPCTAAPMNLPNRGKVRRYLVHLSRGEVARFTVLPAH